VPALRLHGGLPAAERARVRAAITPQSPGPLVVLAIDKIARAAEVHDYVDAGVPMLERMHHKRRRLLEKSGFAQASTPPPAPPGPAPRASTSHRAASSTPRCGRRTRWPIRPSWRAADNGFDPVYMPHR